MAVEILRTLGPLGAEIGGVDLRLPLEASAVAATHRWRRGDLVMWDNRCTMHRRDAFDPAARQILRRTQLSASSR